MPRTKPAQVITYRIEMGTKERMLIQEAFTTYRLQSLLESNLLTEVTKNPLAMIAFIEAILTMIEFFGIETGFATPIDAYDWLKNRFKDPDGEQGTWKAFWDVNLREDWERFFS